MSKTVRNFERFQWIDYTQPTKDELYSIAESFDLTMNLLEDTLEHGHLPKLEKVENYTFIILRAYSSATPQNVTAVGELTNKIAFFINRRELITIHRVDFDFLKKINENYKDSEELLLDIVNRMLLTFEEPLEIQSDRMDQFEQDVFLKNGKFMSVEALYYQKSKAQMAKKVLLLTQEVLGQIKVRDVHASNLQDLQETTTNYLVRYEGIVEESFTILNAYMSLNAKRTNDIMKLLTVFSAFFLPLTFIVGLYGMNFKNMPELNWEYGYFLVLGVMIIVSIIIYIWFKRKKIV